jgi:hypothetical protein
MRRSVCCPIVLGFSVFLVPRETTDVGRDGRRAPCGGGGGGGRAAADGERLRCVPAARDAEMAQPDGPAPVGALRYVYH